MPACCCRCPLRCHREAQFVPFHRAAPASPSANPAEKLAEAWKNTKSIEQVLGGDIEHYDALFVSEG